MTNKWIAPMTTVLYNPYDWYWKKADGTIFSSAAQDYVAEDNPKYQAFLKYARPTPFPKDVAGNDSEAELAKVLSKYNLFVSPKAARKAAILVRYKELDEASMRALRAIRTGKGTDVDGGFLLEIEEEVQTLREEFNSL